MKRKVIQLAGKTYVISLPCKWVKKYGVKKGDEIEVEEFEKSLVINTEKNMVQERKEINTDKLGVLTKRYLFRQYQNGTDEILVHFKKSQDIKKIQEYISELIGFEMVKQGNNNAIISDISGQACQDFDQLTRRLFLLLKGVIEDSHKAFKQKDVKALHGIIYRDVDINKFTHFCIRGLSKKNMNTSEKQALFCIIYMLERISDDFKGFISLIAESKQMPEKKIIDLYCKAEKLFTKIYEFTFDKKLSTAKEIAVIHADLRDRIDQQLRRKKADSHLIVFLQSIVNSLIMLQELQLPYIRSKDLSV